MPKHKRQKKEKIKLDLPSLIASAILGLLFFLAYNVITEKYDVNILLPLQVEDNTIKIVIDNTGDKLLTGQRLIIQSCYSNTSSTYDLPNLYPNRQYIINFDDDEAIQGFKKWKCGDLSHTNFEDIGFPIKTYKNKTNDRLIIPTQRGSIITCGYCFWNITYKSDNFNKTYIDKTYSSMQLLMGVTSDNVSENSTDLVYYSTITWMIFDDRMLRAK